MEKKSKNPVGFFEFHLKSSCSYVLFHPMKVSCLGTYLCIDAIVAQCDISKFCLFVSLSFCLFVVWGGSIWLLPLQ